MVRLACIFPNLLPTLLLGICLSLLPGLASAAVSAHLSAQTIDELETVRLQIKITETRQTSTLDLSELEDDFHIMNTNTMSQSKYINGRGQSWVDYTITLQPKRTGLLQIPSIRVGREQTPTLTLTVKPLSEQTRRKIDDLVFFETDVSSDAVYVQAQLVLTRRLLYSQGVQLYSDLPGAPEIKDAVVLTLGETTSGTTQRDGKNYGVVEQRYAIFPEASGSFTVPGIGITASVRLLEGGRVSRKGVRVTTEPRQIDVLPVPADYPADAPWLPAENVQLIQAISPDQSAYSVGDSLTHELLIHIEGNIGSIAAPQELALEESSFRIYPQAPVINDDTQGSILQGARLQTSTIVPLVPGQLTVPATRLIWWDTNRDRMRIAQAPALSIVSTGTAVPNISPEVQGLAEPGETPADSAEIPLSTGIANDELRAWIAGAALVGLLALVLFLMTRNVKRPPRPRAAARDPQSLDPAAALEDAFKATDLRAIYTYLPTVLADRWGCSTVEAVTRLRGNAEAAEAYAGLESALYRDPPAAMDAGDLEPLQRAINAPDSRRGRRRTYALPALYS